MDNHEAIGKKKFGKPRMVCSSCGDQEAEILTEPDELLCPYGYAMCPECGPVTVKNFSELPSLRQVNQLLREDAKKGKKGSSSQQCKGSKKPVKIEPVRVEQDNLFGFKDKDPFETVMLQARDQRVKISLSEEQKRQINYLAGKKGMDVTELLVEALSLWAYVSWFPESKPDSSSESEIQVRLTQHELQILDIGCMAHGCSRSIGALVALQCLSNEKKLLVNILDQT